MEKTIGHRAVIEVNGFDHARRWIYDMISAGVVKCGQCNQPATHVFWQDQAEWYCRCAEHREYGDQWTGSTRWRPVNFGINVLIDKAREWRKTLTAPEQGAIRFQSYDATDYYSLMVEEWDARTEHYFVGNEKEYGWRVRAAIYPLTNGEYVYELHRDHMTAHAGHMHAYGIRGAWASETLAVEAARNEAMKRKWLQPDGNPPADVDS